VQADDRAGRAEPVAVVAHVHRRHSSLRDHHQLGQDHVIPPKPDGGVVSACTTVDTAPLRAALLLVRIGPLLGEVTGVLAAGQGAAISSMTTAARPVREGSEHEGTGERRDA
jgi:hypothetical protein